MFAVDYKERYPEKDVSRGPFAIDPSTRTRVIDFMSCEASSLERQTVAKLCDDAVIMYETVEASGA